MTPDSAADTTDDMIATLTEEQREAIYRWLSREADYEDVLPSWVWEHAWLPNPGTTRR